MFNDFITNDRIIQNKKIKFTNITNVYETGDIIYTSNLQINNLIKSIYKNKKVLPIPILNYNNNDLYKFYVIISKVYNMKKEYNIYKETNIDLIKLSKHRFCIWRNQWECFYMGVIPITDDEDVVEMLKIMNLPYYKVNDIEHINDNILDETLYKEIFKKSKLYTNDVLKMKTYF